MEGKPSSSDAADFWRADYRYAVVGASRHPEKYGYKIFEKLLARGYSCFPVHPAAEKILGRASYARVLHVPGTLDVAVFITPPEVTLLVLKECKQKGITHVWMQPGSESEEAIAFCKEHGLSYHTQECLLLL